MPPAHPSCRNTTPLFHVQQTLVSRGCHLSALFVDLIWSSEERLEGLTPQQHRCQQQSLLNTLPPSEPDVRSSPAESSQPSGGSARLLQEVCFMLKHSVSLQFLFLTLWISRRLTGCHSLVFYSCPAGTGLEDVSREVNSNAEKCHVSNVLMEAVLHRRRRTGALHSARFVFGGQLVENVFQRSLAGRGRTPRAFGEAAWRSALCFLSSTSSPGRIRNTLSPQTFGLHSCSLSGSCRVCDVLPE